MKYLNIFITSIFLSFNLACSGSIHYDNLKFEDLNSDEFMNKIMDLEEDVSALYFIIAEKMSQVLNTDKDAFSEIPLAIEGPDFEGECQDLFKAFSFITKANLELSLEDFENLIKITYNNNVCEINPPKGKKEIPYNIRCSNHPSYNAGCNKCRRKVKDEEQRERYTQNKLASYSSYLAKHGYKVEKIEEKKEKEEEKEKEEKVPSGKK